MVKNIQGCTNFDTVFVKTGQVSVDAGRDTTICAGQAVRLGITTDSSYGYNWNSNISGFKSVLANPLDTPNTNAWYRVTVTSNSGCKASDSLLVTVKPTPEKPVISENASNELVSSAALGNQWYTGTRVMLTGVNGQQYKPANDGWFTVQTEADGCFSEFASSYHYIIPVVTPTDSTISIRVSPNPTPDNVVVTFKLKDIPNAHYILLDQRGRVLLTATNLSSGDMIPLNGLPVGIYIVRFLHEGNNLQTFRIMKR